MLNRYERKLIRENRKIQAIKEYRYRTNASLKEAKDTVEKWQGAMFNPDHMNFFKNMLRDTCVELSTNTELTPKEIAQRAREIAEQSLNQLKDYEERVEGLEELAKQGSQEQ